MRSGESAPATRGNSGQCEAFSVEFATSASEGPHLLPRVSRSLCCGVSATYLPLPVIDDVGLLPRDEVARLQLFKNAPCFPFNSSPCGPSATRRGSILSSISLFVRTSTPSPIGASRDPMPCLRNVDVRRGPRDQEAAHSAHDRTVARSLRRSELHPFSTASRRASWALPAGTIGSRCSFSAMRVAEDHTPDQRISPPFDLAARRVLKDERSE